MQEVKEWYDGYRFGNAEIYCPWDVINYVDDLDRLILQAQAESLTGSTAAGMSWLSDLLIRQGRCDHQR